MKKSILALFSIAVLAMNAQEAKTWRLGIQIGPQGNRSVYSGGMTEANARFNHNPFGGGALAVMGRYDFDQHWMVDAGIGISTFGFEYALAEDYSLLAKDRKFTTIRSEYAALDIPLMVHYKFNPNCKNVRWVIGAGFSEYITGDSYISRSVSQASDGNSVNYLSSNSDLKGGLFWNFRWTVAREKIFKNKSMLNLALYVNCGLDQIANSTVNYTIDGKDYTHTFSNNGNFAGLRLTYFFRPFYNPWDKKPVNK